MIHLLDSSGFDVVLIETVGVGQDEIEVARLAGVTVVVLVPGAGDDVQALKAGLMEIADVFVINKADLPGIDQLERDVRSSLELAHRSDGWVPKIVSTVASENMGTQEALQAINEYAAFSSRHGRPQFAPEGSYVAEIDHLGIACPSLQQALDFWEQQLGLRVSLRETVEQEKVHVAMLPLGGPRVELLEPTNADSVIGKFLEKRGAGLHHVALRVPDLNATVQRLRTSGAKLLNEPRKGAGGHLYVFVHPSSTGGVLLELIQK